LQNAVPELRFRRTASVEDKGEMNVYDADRVIGVLDQRAKPVQRPGYPR
jgi:hypothetical protein